ncbi:DUF305 domain-containing protein [Agromyces sp. H3Y2-19a]|uniref:DUF305 domain-containing protein n=1 Tax=Agromyces TaxID=33877 RepID=UPI001E5B6FCA|nr:MULTISPECIES: DUF305 domain-containing protein [Agromyces]MCD5345040.1 DUF305 domain-containing protein [Agromyces sp. S2-1-8]MDF0513779.1 DUF305 domain-containing protein [Agromyces chromiiresistens]
MNTTQTLRAAAAAAIAATAALAFAACSAAGGGTGTSAGTDPGSANDADVMFARMMIPHHEQAVEMSDDLLAKDGIDPAVRDLATQIKDAQQPEIDQLNTWLEEWGAVDDAMPGMDHGDGGGMDHGSSGDGMMSDDDMAALAEATGDEASRLFLEQMIVHHEGAIEMAEAELADGAHPGALEMAQAIADTQADEIATMQELLGEG